MLMVFIYQHKIKGGVKMYKILKINKEKYRENTSLEGWDYLIVGDLVTDKYEFSERGDGYFYEDMIETIWVSFDEKIKNLLQYDRITPSSIIRETRAGNYELVFMYDTIKECMEFVDRRWELFMVDVYEMKKKEKKDENGK